MGNIRKILRMSYGSPLIQHGFFPFQDDWALDDKYAKLTVVDGDYFHNSVRFHKFTFEENLAKLEKAVNRTKWSMTPPQVNQLLIKLDS